MADGNGQSDGEGGRTSQVRPLLVTRGKHGEDEYKCDEEFNAESLEGTDVIRHSSLS